MQNDLLAQASVANQSGPNTKPDPDLKVRTALDRAANRISGKLRQPAVEANLRDTIGQTYMDLGLYPQAGAQLERALDLRRRLLGTENPETLRTMDRLGNLADRAAGKLTGQGQNCGVLGIGAGVGVVGQGVRPALAFRAKEALAEWDIIGTGQGTGALGVWGIGSGASAKTVPMVVRSASSAKPVTATPTASRDTVAGH